MTNRFLTLAAMLTIRIPNLVIRNKSESWLWMKLAPRKLRDMGQCLPTLRKVAGRLRIVPVIWLPAHLDLDLTHLLAHEGQHALDIAAGPWRFIGRYLTPKGRTLLELRGYIISLHSRYGWDPRVKNLDRVAIADRYAEFLSSGTYLWPCSHDVALEALLEYCAVIQRGHPVQTWMPTDMMEILDGLSETEAPSE